ncbi:MAG TPA: DUF2336 domain-containing protein [Xanthobacteraceae bacterium]
MIVRQFLHWVHSAPAGERAEAAGALARAYILSDLSSDDRAAVEGAMIMLLDDPSPLVRRALAQDLAASRRAPPAVIHALANDQPDIAAIVLERSALFLDADLVELVATGAPKVQAAIARRTALPRTVAAAIAEVGAAETCLTLIENSAAEIARFSISRMVERFGHLAAIREALLARTGLPASIRQTLALRLADALANFVAARAWIDGGRARRIATEACEKATVMIAASAGDREVRSLVRHLRASAQLNAGLLLRALLSGNVVLFEEALADLANLPLARVRAIVRAGRAPAFRALYHRAGLPASAYPAFREAVAAMGEASYFGGLGGSGRLKRRMIERVLAGCGPQEVGDVEPLLMLLRRFATEAAREEARLYCEQLAGDDAIDRAAA